MHPPRLPHPRDIKRNVSSKPPIFLNDAWLEGAPAVESRIKRLEDDLDYVRHRASSAESAAERTAERLYEYAVRVRDQLAVTWTHRPRTVNLENLARNKGYFLSSAWGGTATRGKVVEKRPYFFHTAIETDQCITIDLDIESELHSMVVTNRTDTCLERARCLFYEVHDEAVCPMLNAYPLGQAARLMDRKLPRAETPMLGAKGRYVSIFSPVKTALHFSDIEIYGRVAE